MHFSSLVIFLFLALGYGCSALAGDGLLNRQVGGEVSGAVSSHGHTYLAQGSTLVTVNWDEAGIPAVADVSAPVEGLIRQLAIAGDSLWASATWEFERGRLFEYSLQAPDSPQLLREWRLDNQDYHRWGVLKRVDDLLYIGSNDGTLSAYRLAESGVLKPVFEWALPPAGSFPGVRSFKALESWEDDVLLAVVERDSSYDLYMLDITDPENPEEISRFSGVQSLAHTRRGDEIMLVGQVAHQVIDWSDLANPHVAYLQFGGPYLRGGRFEAGYLIGYTEDTITVYDVTDITAIEPVTSVYLGELTSWLVNEPQSAPVANMMIFVTASAELLALDLSSAREPQLHHVLDLPPGFNVRRVRETEDMLVAVTEDSLSRLSENLRPQWRFPTSPAFYHRFSDVVIGDQWLALSSNAHSAFVFRPGTLEGGEQITESTPYYVDRLAWDGEILWSFGLGFYHDMELHNLSDPARPDRVIVNSRRFGHIRDMARKGDVVYLADESRGITVARLTPSGPELATPVYLPECNATSVAVQADLLVAACRDDGPVLYDLSVPDAPLLIARVEPEDASSQGWDVLLDDDLLWYSHSRGVSLLDINDPSRPLLIERSPPFAVFDVRWSQDSGRLSRSNRGGVWVAAGALGLLELNSVSPVGPEWTGIWHDPNQVGQGLVLEVLAANRAMVTWFVYDTRGRQRWLQGVGQYWNNRIEIPEVYLVDGPRFAASGEFLDIDVVGSARLVFHDCNTGVVELEADGATRVSHIEPLAGTMKTGCRLSDDSVETPQATQSGLWFDPQRSGQGISLVWLDNGRALMNWFTYDPDGNQLWVQGVGDLVESELLFTHLYTTLATRHGIQYDPGMFQILPWGEAVLELGCEEGSLQWNASHGSFGSGQMSLRRLTTPLGLEC